MDHILEAEAETFGPGVLNLFPFKYSRVIKQSTRTPRSTGKAVVYFSDVFQISISEAIGYLRNYDANL